VTSPPVAATRPTANDAAVVDSRGDGGRSPLELKIVETCDAPMIPRDAGFYAEDGGPAPNVRLEVPYGTDVKQTLDVAWPQEDRKSEGRRPIVAIIHGGGWTAGDKHMFFPTMRALVDHGWVAATINYRLARDEARAFPAGVRDTRCALAWIVKHAHEMNGDPERLALIGASAGGHLAALIGVAPDEWADGCDDVKLHVAGVISYYAPLDFRTIEDKYPRQMQMAVWELLRADAGSPEWKDRALRATPETFLDESDPPFLLLHGSADTVVPVDDSRAFKRALDARGIPALLVEVEGQKHGFPVLSRREDLLTATCTAWDFLERVFAR
jgi:acetyl esterase/lipase